VNHAQDEDDAVSIVERVDSSKDDSADRPAATERERKPAA